MSTISLHFIPAAGGAALTIHGQTGQSVMQAAVGAGIEGIAADCGGLLTCATCHVRVRAPHADRLPPPDDDEQSMLDYTASPRSPDSRLSCQIMLTEALDGITLELPATQY